MEGCLFGLHGCWGSNMDPCACVADSLPSPHSSLYPGDLVYSTCITETLKLQGGSDAMAHLSFACTAYATQSSACADLWKDQLPILPVPKHTGIKIFAHFLPPRTIANVMCLARFVSEKQLVASIFVLFSFVFERVSSLRNPD